MKHSICKEKMHPFSRRAFISTHSLEKALYYIKYESMDTRDPEKKNFWTCKAPFAESMRDGDVICCNLNTENYA